MGVHRGVRGSPPTTYANLNPKSQVRMLAPLSRMSVSLCLCTSIISPYVMYARHEQERIRQRTHQTTFTYEYSHLRVDPLATSATRAGRARLLGT